MEMENKCAGEKNLPENEKQNKYIERKPKKKKNGWPLPPNVKIIRKVNGKKVSQIEQDLERTKLVNWTARVENSCRDSWVDTSVIK